MTSLPRTGADPPAARAADGRWLLHEHAIVRTTGFPWELLDLLDHPRTRAALDRLERAEAAVEAAVGGAVRAAKSLGADALDPRTSRRVRKALTRRNPLPDPLGLPPSASGLDDALRRYNAAVAARDAAAAAVGDVADAEAGRVHAALARLASTDPRFREAVWACSPSMHDRGLAELADTAAAPHSGRAPAVRRQVAGYLQRLCAKNETVSFFGPIDYADFAPSASPARLRTGPPVRRRARVASWVVAALADRLAAEPQVRPFLRPRVAPTVAGLEGPHPSNAGRRMTLGPAALALLRSMDGRTSVRDLAAAAGLALPAALAAVDELAAKRMIVAGMRPPVVERDALAALRRAAAGLPADLPARDAWLGELDRLLGLASRFEETGLEERRGLLAEIENRVEAVTGRIPRRGGGQWYADRLAVHEECLGALTPLHLGPRVHDLLQRELGPVLTLLGAEAVARHRALTAAMLRLRPELAAGAVVPLIRLLTDCEDLRADDLPSPPRRWIEEQVAGASGEVSLDPGRIPVADLGGDPLIASPDVMFLAAGEAELLAGDADIVLSECHDSFGVWGWALQFHDREDEVLAAGARLLERACAGWELASVLGSSRTKIVPPRFPGLAVDAGGAEPGPAVVRLAEVGVRLAGDRLACCAPGHPRFLLRHGGLDSPVHNVLAPPRITPVEFGDGGYTPRIRIGRVVVQRARWRIAVDELLVMSGARPSAAQTLRRAHAAARRLGLPRHVFALIPGERKPILLDLQAPALLDLARHLCRGHDSIVLTEMLPGPDRLWLGGESGRHCAEFRVTLAWERG